MYTIGFREISPGVVTDQGIAVDIQPPLDLDSESLAQYLVSENFDDEQPDNSVLRSVNLLGSTDRTVIYADITGPDEIFKRTAKQQLGKRIAEYLKLMGEESQIIE